MRWILIALCLAVLACDSEAAGEGAEILVNTFTSGSQAFWILDVPIAELANGGFVIAWTSQNQDGPNQNGLPNYWNGVFGQVFDADCVKVGNEFPLHTTTTGNQGTPALAALDADEGGGFVALWRSSVDEYGDTFTRYQKFSSDGTKVGSEMDGPGGPASRSTIAKTNNGFVVAWEQRPSKASNSYDIYAQRFTASFALEGSPFKVTSAAVNWPWYWSSHVASGLPGGGFVIVFSHSHQVYSRVYDSPGSAVTNPVLVNPGAAEGPVNYALEPSITALDNGEFVVVWEVKLPAPGANYIKGQRLDASGSLNGPSFTVYPSDNTQGFPTIKAMPTNGGFFVGWQESANLWAQLFDSNADTVGDRFQVNNNVLTGENGPTSFVHMIVLGDNRPVFTWRTRNPHDVVAIIPCLPGYTGTGSNEGCEACPADTYKDTWGNSACLSSATCSDGRQNQGETGVDCGGPCGSCCGNGRVDPGEDCDDGNSVDTDTCSITCVACTEFQFMPGSPEIQSSAACAQAPFNTPLCQETRTHRRLDSTFDGRKGPNRGAVSGGLGKYMTNDDRFLSWMCLKNHECLSAPGVGGVNNDFMCFAYDEQENKFIPWGKQSDLRLF